MAGASTGACKELKLTLGGAPLFDDAGICAAQRRARHSLAPTAAGKSTLIRMMAGLTRADGGEIIFASKRHHRVCATRLNLRGLRDITRLCLRAFSWRAGR